MLHTGYKVIGYTFAKQSYWYKLRGLHVYKAILLVQLRGLLFKLKICTNSIGTNGTGFCSNLGTCGLFSSPTGFYWVHIDWLAPGHPMGAENPTISPKPKPKSWPPAGPGPLPVVAPCQPQPRQPHIIKLFFSASKTNKKNIRHMNYRHW